MFRVFLEKVVTGSSHQTRTLGKTKFLFFFVCLFFGLRSHCLERSEMKDGDFAIVNLSQDCFSMSLTLHRQVGARSGVDADRGLGITMTFPFQDGS